MNYSTTTDSQNRHFLAGNFGASVFMATYIGFYGLGMIVYFASQFMTDNREDHENEIPNEFFSTFHCINERQKIYNQLTDKNWIKEMYQIYYSDEPLSSELIEQKTNECSKKYYDKMQTLQLKHAYYVTEIQTPSVLNSVSCID